PALARGRQRAVAGDGVAGRDLAQQQVARPPATFRAAPPEELRAGAGLFDLEGPSVSVAGTRPRRLGSECASRATGDGPIEPDLTYRPLPRQRRFGDDV